MNKDTIIKVTNRNSSVVGYAVPDNVNGLERIFAPGETKDITFEELEKLAWTTGGKVLLKEYLVMHDNEAISLILGDVEPEYHYTKEDVERLLMSGSVEEFLDCLDFGTEGVIDIIKTLAVELEVPDMRKRQAIAEKTGFNVNTAIELKHLEEEDDDEEKNQAETKTRRAAAPTTATEEPQRRAAAPVKDKYKVVSK